MAVNYQSPFGMFTIDNSVSTERPCLTMLNEDGWIKVRPAEEWRKFHWNEVRLFMHQYPVYVLPTLELIQKLNSLIERPDKTIEIGAGSGNIGRNLGIRMTDSYQQARPDMMAFYQATGQPVIKYPSTVIKADACTALRRFKPECVLGCYVTQKWRKGMKDGNMYGVDFERLLQFKTLKRLILVGNKNIHRENPIMQLRHTEICLDDGLITRNEEHSANRIFVWDTDTI